MTALFQPADGDRARWRHVYELVLSRTPGDDITVQEVCDLLNIPAHTAWAVMLDAKKHLEQDRQQTVKSVSKFGWIVIDAKGNLDEIERRRHKAHRATSRAARLITATDRGALSPIDRNRLDFETRNVLAARSLYDRKSRSFAELQRESQQRRITDSTAAPPSQRTTGN
ncbi:hypothetical protein CFN78_06935 [Amycolatopsis antarctica]|uniref:Uncharacterized protein n=1 Tax=Amycolatopsis antarctica TaxID=1854586 RepID=A0A263D969_9PSEU|nr:hypothetical protein [Amycolatopsis antarctica]OZM74016.1 hypothetical protein CFN78_06935 [Amycolatopsis antarctica]